jgi:uracil DNA glycosylase
MSVVTVRLLNKLLKGKASSWKSHAHFSWDNFTR